jgi:hypothetical protein
MLAIFLKHLYRTGPAKSLLTNLRNFFYKALEGLLHDGRKSQLKWCNMLVLNICSTVFSGLNTNWHGRIMICILTFIYMNENGIWCYSNYWIMCGALWFLIWRRLIRTFQLYVFFFFFRFYMALVGTPLSWPLARPAAVAKSYHLPQMYAGYEAAAFFSFTILFLRFMVLL